MRRKDIELALQNINEYGDTDIFPFPIDNLVFFDRKEQVVQLILNMHKNLDAYLKNMPPCNINTVSPKEKLGFRWATQIDPVWNAYFLSLVLSFADHLEGKRITIKKQAVHSYRFHPDNKKGSLFNPKINYHSFLQVSADAAEKKDCKYVLKTDIADYYNRIDHQNLIDVLTDARVPKRKIQAVMKLLKVFSGGKPYGLPIGGPAARILAEAALVRTDAMLSANKIKFTRFMDDYCLFAGSELQANEMLRLLATHLIAKERLNLQMHKTRILTASDFVSSITMKDEKVRVGAKKKAGRKFKEHGPDYFEERRQEKQKNLRKERSIIADLDQESNKSIIDSPRAKMLLRRLKYYDDAVVSDSIVLIAGRFSKFFPVFRSLLVAITRNYHKLNDDSRKSIFGRIKEMVEERNYFTRDELHAAYLIKLLGKENSPVNHQLVMTIYAGAGESPLVKYWNNKVLTRWGVFDWLDTIGKHYDRMNTWERKVMLIANIMKHRENGSWLENNRDKLSDYEKIIAEWAHEKQKIDGWEVPL